MQHFIAILCLIGAAGLLIQLSLIDLRVRLLPNVLVLPFALLALLFHATAPGATLSPMEIIAGAALGFGILYGIRLIANHLYQQDTLGLGDVKLMGAGGLWLGPDNILMALSLGALFGMLHGLGVAAYQAKKNGTKINLNTLEVPAGPGFALGIVVLALYQYQHLLGL